MRKRIDAAGRDITDLPGLWSEDDREIQCLSCGGSGRQMPECSCYEIIGGHQQGCCFYGMTAAQISEMSGKSWPCHDCNPQPNK